jgi:hypothetical protein
MGGSFAPPGVDAGNVNPMGSTFVADTPSPVAFPPPASGGAPFGVQPPVAPPVDSGYGPPTQQTPAPNMAPYNAPPQALAPPQMAPPPVYTNAPLAIAPPTGLSGPGPGYGDAGAMAPYTPPGALASPIGTPRNPVTVLLLSSFCLWVGLNQLRQIETDLNRFVGKNEPGSILWLLFPLIPLLAMPKLIAAARARAGTATQGEPSLPLYLFLGPYALPKDANEIWAAAGSRPG